MAIRKCPQCLTVLPAGHVVAYSNGMECPGCKRELEVSPASRFLATLAGLLAAVLVWRLAAPGQGHLGFVLPLVYSFFAFSIVAPLALMLSADLRNKPEEAAAPAQEENQGHTAPSGAGHSAHH